MNFFEAFREDEKESKATSGKGDTIKKKEMMMCKHFGNHISWIGDYVEDTQIR